MGLLLELILQLLWHAFVWCLTQYPAPTLAVVAVVALFAWSMRDSKQSIARLESPEDRISRANGLTPDDTARISDLADTMTHVGRAGFALSAALVLAGLITAAMRSGSGSLVLAGLAEIAAGVVAAITSRKVLGAAESFRTLTNNRESPVTELVGGAAEQVRALFEWVGDALALFIAALAVAVVVGFCLGA